MEFWYSVDGIRRGNADSVDFVKLPSEEADGPGCRAPGTILEQMGSHRQEPGSGISSGVSKVLTGEGERGRTFGRDSGDTVPNNLQKKHQKRDSASARTAEAGRSLSSSRQRRPPTPGLREGPSQPLLSRIADSDRPLGNRRRASGTAATKTPASHARKDSGNLFVDQLSSENTKRTSKLPGLPKKLKTTWK